MGSTTTPRRPAAPALAATAVAVLAVVFGCAERGGVEWETPTRMPTVEAGGRETPLNAQKPEEAAARGAGCAGCHRETGDPHPAGVNLACVDCHGGDGLATTIERAHPKPLHPDRWPTSANPKRTYTLLNHESPDWIRFVNPGDLRVAPQACGPCHGDEVLAVSKSLMTTAAHFWGTASYANGITSNKRTIFGESYAPDGAPRRVNSVPPPTKDEADRGVVDFVVPLPNFEVTQPGNVLRVFEKGSRLPNPVVGVPDKLEDAGRPNNRLSDRGLGTLNRVDLPLLNVHKTRLNDPHLSFLGTNDNPGDYRSSGCTACHVVYANDRTPTHAGRYAKFGNTGRLGENRDPTLADAADEPGHPIAHRFTTAIPSSQCMTCHMHQPNSFVNTYYGFQMWSYETDGAAMWPARRRDPTAAEIVGTSMSNPEGAAPFGKWGDAEFLKDVAKLNPTLKHTQFADYHGHGWIFRAVFKTDRKGNLLDKEGRAIPYDDPDKFRGVVPIEGMDDPFFAPAPADARRAVHLKDVHAEYGMHCVDCHFVNDVHGDGKLYGEYQAAVTIGCKDCHGTVRRYADGSVSGPASKTENVPNLSQGRVRWTRDGKTEKLPRFVFRRDGTVVQRSMLDAGREWTVKQVKDSVDPTKPGKFNPRAAYAKTLRRDGKTWGALPRKNPDGCALAHDMDEMECYACHTSWVTSCFGCHLPQKADWRSPENHFGGEIRRNYATYNPQVARDDAFMLAIAGDVKGHKYSTARSSSAVLISSEDGLRRKIYSQIPTTAANGMSSQAFNTHFAHTVRTTETRGCDDCHVSERNDNNAWLAQVNLLGTNFVNFVGYNAFVGLEDGGFEAVRVTEWDEPQAVLGSNLHRLAYPEAYAAFEAGGRRLSEHEEHGGSGVRSLQLRGEYLYAACGEGGFRAYDVANVNNKDFSEKIVTQPVSPLGQDAHVATRFATAVALATNNATSMARVYRPENRETPYAYEGREQNLHETYRYAYVTDRFEGLVIVDVDPLTDGDPRNNFLKRVVTFNPEGRLDGAESLAVAGSTLYACCARGLVVIDIEDPLHPKIVAEIGAPQIRAPRSVAVQFRYAFVCDADGLKIVDVTTPGAPVAVDGARLAIKDARDVYVARTYAYVAGGAEGLVVVDVERPEAPRIDQVFNAGGAIDDLRQVKVGMTNDSVFAYLADGRNGLRVLQLVTPEDGGRSAYGFSPRPAPRLIATKPTAEPAIALSKGLDRDRAVDESGHQMAVFGRIGGRPMNLAEMRRLYMKDGSVFRTSNEPSSRPVDADGAPIGPPAKGSGGAGGR